MADERDSVVEELIAREGELVQRVRELEKQYKIRRENPADPVLRPRAEELLKLAEELAERVTPIFIDSPMTSLNDAKFGWAVYEIANARLNLIYLLLFGCNQVAARKDSLVLEALT